MKLPQIVDLVPRAARHVNMQLLRRRKARRRFKQDQMVQILAAPLRCNGIPTTQILITSKP